MEISWKVYLTEEGYRTRCKCGQEKDDHSLMRHHVINQTNIFDPSQGYCMEVHDPDNCGGSVDLIGYLEDLGLQEDDVLYIEPASYEADGMPSEISEADLALNDLIRKLGSHEVWPIFDCCEFSRICIVPALQKFGLVEFQVSDNLPGLRGSSSDVYTYSEAKKIFEEQVRSHFERVDHQPA